MQRAETRDQRSGKRASLAIAVLIKLDSSGPVFFRQVRVGRHGQQFGIYKFRSMRQDADRDPPVEPRWREHWLNRLAEAGEVALFEVGRRFLGVQLRAR